jgi:hypothetical protein
VRRVAATVAFVAVVAGGGAGIAALLNRSDAEPQVIRCAASLDGTDWYLAPDQADTVALLAGQAMQRGLPARALTIAIATGLQESKLRNIDGGDRDSIGIFQQRPSQGWGTVEQIMDPVFATTAFFDALQRVEGYQEMPITEAAQAVQRSAFPEAYGQHEGSARAWASAMYGYSAGTVTCSLPAADSPGDAQAVIVRAQRDLGISGTATEAGVLLDATPLIAAPEHAERVGWAVAHWAVAVAEPMAVTSVQYLGSTWDRDEGVWSPSPETASPETAAPPPGQVLVPLAD